LIRSILKRGIAGVDLGIADHTRGDAEWELFLLQFRAQAMGEEERGLVDRRLTAWIKRSAVLFIWTGP